MPQPVASSLLNFIKLLSYKLLLVLLPVLPLPQKQSHVPMPREGREAYSFQDKLCRAQREQHSLFRPLKFLVYQKDLILMLFSVYLYFHSPHSFSHLPLPYEVQRHYHCVPYGPNHADSQKVWWSVIWVTQLSLVYLGHPVLSYFR